MPEIKEFVLATDIKKWEAWLKKNHLKKDTVFLMKYKKHTGKKTFTHNEAMRVAIQFGWIDTTVKRIDDEKYGHFFRKRHKNSGWSKNTLQYAKEIATAGKMSLYGMEMYKLGLKKPTIDHGISKNPAVPDILKKALSKNKKAKLFFESLAPSYRRIYIIMVETAKRPETKEKRVKWVVDKCAKKEKQ